MTILYKLMARTPKAQTVLKSDHEFFTISKDGDYLSSAKVGMFNVLSNHRSPQEINNQVKIMMDLSKVMLSRCFRHSIRRRLPSRQLINLAAKNSLGFGLGKNVLLTMMLAR